MSLLLEEISNLLYLSLKDSIILDVTPSGLTNRMSKDLMDFDPPVVFETIK